MTAVCTPLCQVVCTHARTALPNGVCMAMRVSMVIHWRSSYLVRGHMMHGMHTISQHVYINKANARTQGAWVPSRHPPPAHVWGLLAVVAGCCCWPLGFKDPSDKVLDPQTEQLGAMHMGGGDSSGKVVHIRR
jgi:hypothetical protein